MSISVLTSLKPLEENAVQSSGQTEASQKREDAKLDEACRMFEAMFLNMLWKEMRGTVDKGELFNGGFGEEMFSDMLDQAVSENSVKNGSMGIADMLKRQLTQQIGIRAGGNLKDYPGYGLSTGEFTTPVSGTLTSGFGSRVHPITGELKNHDGVDLATEEGEPVQAAWEGVVSFAGEKGDYGNLVEITHTDGRVSRYGHLSEIGVSVGQKVSAGQVVGKVGSTGLSTGPHLHFEVRNVSGQATDPMQYLAGSFKRAA